MWHWGPQFGRRLSSPPGGRTVLDHGFIRARFHHPTPELQLRACAPVSCKHLLDRASAPEACHRLAYERDYPG